MKLHEIRHWSYGHPDYDSNTPDNPVQLYVRAPEEYGEEVQVEVTYTWEKGHDGSFDEPPDSGEIDIQKAVLAADVQEMNEDGDVVKTWKKGTKVEDVKGLDINDVYSELDTYLAGKHNAKRRR